VRNLYTHFPVRLESVRNETEDKNVKTFEFEFLNQENAESFFDQQTFRPGQFAMLWVPGYGEIPLGIASSPTEKYTLKFSVNKIGKVTRHLHSLPPGSTLGIRGPLGNGFPWQELKGKTIAFIGGGYAFTTLRASLVYLLDPANRGDVEDIWLFYGARTPGMLLYREELESWAARSDVKTHIAVNTDNTSKWKHHLGPIPTIVSQVLPPGDCNSVAIICGPPIMNKYAILALREKDYRPNQVYLSLENRMKCGVGHCGRCTIGKDSVCSDGPVFSMTEVEKMPDDY